MFLIILRHIHAVIICQFQFEPSTQRKNLFSFDLLTLILSVINPFAATSLTTYSGGENPNYLPLSTIAVKWETIVQSQTIFGSHFEHKFWYRTSSTYSRLLRTVNSHSTAKPTSMPWKQSLRRQLPHGKSECAKVSARFCQALCMEHFLKLCISLPLPSKPQNY